MSLILSIETAASLCSAALHEQGVLIGSRDLMAERSHSMILAPMIRDLFADTGKAWKELSAVALSRGPGSYTGLRIGTSTAKGICYALDIPLIAINTLLSMCHLANLKNPGDFYLCPMLDARRMEVYAMIADAHLTVKKDTKAIIVDEGSFRSALDSCPILFFGEGMPKTRHMLENHPNAYFLENIFPHAESVGFLALEKYRNREFENLEAFEPFYLKEFIATVPRKLI
ncbi:MAG: tRNA (adenosine(37)-N6)-threonylcarbamoyltransferase complex dimerization subunit type 1 TsaB [Cyclobacteriaceae bacterium]|nr:tRNA (adenosine(37)-N6)-threonylcarbamoyltransferase complex dimerization subunit type 1 TsaB [Cyclobacteriaceae bacterium]